MLALASVCQDHVPHVSVKWRRRDTYMTKKWLDEADIDVGFQLKSRRRMPKHMGSDAALDSRAHR